MKSRSLITLSIFMGALTAGSAAAAPLVGTAKARGDYRPGAWRQSSSGYARSYSYRAPARYSAPVVQSAPAPMVAHAPDEGRRFSYAPSAAASNPCGFGHGQAQAAPAPVNENRRFSYAPAPEPAAAAGPVARDYYQPRYRYSRPSYSSGGRSQGPVNRAILPKTHPRKFSG
jgi:hypothetical protein